MCFKNLPIDFDNAGNAKLKDGWKDPYAFEPTASRSYLEALAASGATAPPRLRDWSIDPVTRVAGALAIHTVLDLDKRVAVEAHSLAMLFRGYEIILKGRDPRDRSEERRVGKEC